MADLAALLLLQSASVDEPRLRNVTPTEMNAALQSCGLLHVSVFHDETTQSDMVIIKDNQANDEALACAFRAQDRTAYFLYWEDPLRERYYAIAEEVMRPRATRNARTFLARRYDLAALPIRQSGQSEIDFARQLERFCGPDAHGFFSDEFGSITVSQNWLDARHYSQTSEVIGCIMNAAYLAELEWGFIGNEKLAEELAD